MNIINNLFRKYIWNSIIILFVFLAINLMGAIIFFTAMKTHTIDADREVEEIAQGISQNDEGHIFIEENASKLLSDKKSWAMILDATGKVIWDYQMPKELPREYSASDVAGFSRWYLEEYPVLVQQLNCGLLVVGYQPDEMLGISMVKLYYVTDSGFLRVVAIGSVLLIGMNIFVVVLLFLHNTRRIEKEIVPIIHGIEEISKGKWVELPKEGELASINQKLNLASQYMMKKDKARADWINGISHDVRTPLSLIMGYAGEMKEDFELDGKVRKQAGIILGQAEKIKRLITDLNLVSKLEHSMQPLRKEKIDFLELGRQVISDFLNNGLDEKYEMAYDTSSVSRDILYMEGDKYLLRRMLENLIQNSISHNPDGCRITLSIQETKGKYILTVSDDGSGVVKEKLEQLNQGIISEGDYMDSGEAAHGYGLKLVRQIVEAHHGEILFKESSWKGLSVEISLMI